MKTNQIFNANNFILLCKIMDRNEGVIEDCTKINPNKKVFHKPLKTLNLCFK